MSDHLALLAQTERDAETIQELRADAEHFRGLLLWALYYHQGSGSDVGQPIRKALGIGQFDRMTREQIKAGRTAAMKGIK